MGERDAAIKEKEALAAEQKKIEDAAYREERKKQKEQEEIEKVLSKEAKAKAKKQAQAMQKDRDEMATEMAAQEKIDKKRRYDFLMNSPAGDVFKNFFESSQT